MHLLFFGKKSKKKMYNFIDVTFKTLHFQLYHFKSHTLIIIPNN